MARRQGDDIPDLPRAAPAAPLSGRLSRKPRFAHERPSRVRAAGAGRVLRHRPPDRLDHVEGRTAVRARDRLGGGSCHLPEPDPPADRAAPRADEDRAGARPRGARPGRGAGGVRRPHPLQLGRVRRRLRPAETGGRGRPGEPLPPALGVGARPCSVPARRAGRHLRSLGEAGSDRDLRREPGRPHCRERAHLPVLARHHAFHPLLPAPRRVGVRGHR